MSLAVTVARIVGTVVVPSAIIVMAAIIIKKFS